MPSPSRWRSVLLATLGVAVAVLAVVHLPPVQSAVAARVVRALGDAGILARVDRLDYNLLTRRVTALGVRLASADTPDTPFLEAARVEVVLPWRTWLGSFSLSVVDVRDATLTIVVEETGRDNLPGGGDGDGGLSRLDVDRASVSGFSVHYDNHRDAVHIAVSDVALELHPVATGARGTVRTGGPVVLEFGEVALHVRDVAGYVEFDGASVVLDEVRFEVIGARPNGARHAVDATPAPRPTPALSAGVATTLDALASVRVDGRFDGVFESPRIEATVGGTASAGPVARWLDVEPAPSGTIDWTGTVTGPVASPTVTVEASSSHLAYQTLESIALDTSLVITTEAVRADRIHLSVAGGEVSASGSLSFDEADESRLAASWRALRADQLATALSAPVVVGAMLDGRVDATWRDDLASADVELVHEARPAPGPGLAPLSGRATLTTKDGAWRLDHAHRTGEAATVAGRAGGRLLSPLGDSTLAGTLSVDVPSVPSLLGLVRAGGVDLPRDLESTVDGQGTITGTLAGTLATPRFSGRLDASGLRVEQARDGRLAATLRADTRTVDVGDIEVALDDIAARGDVTLGVERETLDGRVALRVADLGVANRIAGRTEDRWPLSGPATFDVTLSGTRSRPIVDVLATLGQVGVFGQILTGGEAAIRLADDRLSVDRFEARQDEGSLRATGAFHLGRQDIDIRLEGRRLAIAPVVLVAGGDPIPVEALVDEVTFEAAGPLARPVGRGRIAISGAGVDDYSIGRAEVDLVLDDGHASVEVALFDLDVDAEARAALVSPWAFTAAVRVDTDDLRKPLPPHLRDTDRVLGQIALEATASGNLATPADADVTARLLALDAQIGRTPLVLERAEVIRWANREVETSGVALRLGDTQFSLAGRLGRPGDRLSLTMAGPADDLEALIALAGFDEAASLSGTIKARVDVLDTIDRPGLDGTLLVTGGALRFADLPAIGALEVDAALDDGVLRLARAEAAWQGARASASGRLPMRLLAPWLPAVYVDGLRDDDPTARLEARVDDLTERALAPFVDADTLAALEGAFAATATLEASDVRVSAVRGRIEFERAAVEIAQVPLAQTSPTRLVLEDGRLRVEEWVWTGAGNRLEVVGGLSMSDDGDVRVDAAADALIDLRLLGAFVDGLSTAGRVDVSLAAGGPIGEPEIDGRIIVTGGEARLREPRLAVSGVAGSLVLRGDELRIDRMTGTANGGPIEFGGRARFPGFDIGEIDVSLTGRNIAMEVVDGLQTEVNIALMLSQTTATATPRLFGEVTVLRGGYRRTLSLAQLLRGQGTPAPRAAPAAATGLMAMRLDVALVTREDLAFDNNYGRFEMGADLRLIGTLAEPALTGRAEMREGGQVFLGGNRYQIERGTVDFTNPTRIEPEIDLTARTRIRGNEITLNVSGTPETITADLSSDDPTLGQGDIVSLLLTGRTRDETGGAEAEVARDQLLGLLSGELLGAAGRAVGLDAVRIERSDDADLFDVGPWALADETDPSSRITLTKNLGQQFELAFSQSLRETNSITWIATYRPGRNVDLRLVSRDNTSMAYEVRQDVSFGGTSGARTARRARAPAPRVSDVTIEGVDAADRAALERRLRIRRGSSFDFFRWQDDRDRLLAYFHDLGHYEASIDATRGDTVPGEDGGTVALAYAVAGGPRTVLDVEGIELPVRTEREMIAAWIDTVYDGFLLDDLEAIAGRALLADGYLEADVTAEVRSDAGPDEKRVLVRIVPGPRVTDRRIEFTGHRAIGRRRLEQILGEAGVADAVWREPSLAEGPIREAYEREGRLAASVTAGRPDVDGDRARLAIAIDEGPPFLVGPVDISGASRLAEAVVRDAFRLDPGDDYDPGRAESARRRVEQGYRREGFNAARLVLRQTVDPDGATVALGLDIEEGPQQILTEIVVDGADHTRASVVARAIRVEPGRPVDLSEWYQARRRLYQTGVFRRADVEPEVVGTDGTRAEPATAESAQAAGVDAATADPDIEEVRARVSLVEWPLYRFRYGFQIDDDRASDDGDGRGVRPGVAFDLQRRNLIGIADTAGVAVRLENRRWAVRTFVSSPRFFALPLMTNLFLTRSRETVGGGGTFLPFVTTRWDVTAEQRYRRGRAMSFNYGYRYEWNRTFDPDRDPDDPFGFDITVNIARLSTGMAGDTRDDPFDASRGWFHSSNVEYASEQLGSDLRFVKYLLQQYYFREVRPGLVLASAARLGLSDGFGQEIVPSERFFAGGGNSVRGFAEDSLGQQSFLGDARGGEALLVLNQEVRFPIRGFLRGVAFVDAGNVFANPRRIVLRELEVGLGGGLRIDTPFALVRIDLGVPVTRPRGERTPRWFFSIGQAF